MKTQRKDRRGRGLRTGEDQLTDGRYRYRYTDGQGCQKAVYSWRLIASDRCPEGKRKGESLREKETRIRDDLRDGIDSGQAAQLTLNEMFARYMATKTDLRRSSRMHYEYLYRTVAAESLGRRKLRDIRYSDIKALYSRMRTEKAYKPRTVETMHNILHPVFEMAVRDSVLRRNPTDGIMSELRQNPNWTPERRHALTEAQQSAFVRFTADSPAYHKWLPLFTFLLGTGCRIGETLGLRWENIDFEAGTIRIDHTLSYLPGESGRREFHCTPPKTAASIRTIPMMDAVREALRTEQRRQRADGFAMREIDGWTDYVFTNSAGNLHCAATVNQVIDRICNAYNKAQQCRAARNGEEALLLPHFSAHSLRHSFCARLCENESNIKIIQEIMGHSSIETTMDIYAEISDRRKQSAIYNLEGKVRIC